MIKNRADIESLNKYISFDEAELDVIGKEAERINAGKALKKAAEKAYNDIFISRLRHEDAAASLESRGISDNNGLFWAVVYLSGLPLTVRYYEEKNIPVKVLRDSLQDMPLWMRFYSRTHDGSPGLQHPHWMWWSFCGRLFRLGRLQFAPGVFNGDTNVFKKNGEFVFLDAKETAGLSLDEYEKILCRGDKILEVHIPAGKSLDEDVCNESFHFARQFFSKHLKYDFKAYTCFSWLLDPNWKRLLPERSNIRSFCERFRLMPARTGEDNSGVKFFVFENKDIYSPDTAAETSLQRIIKEEIKKGTVFREGFGFIQGALCNPKGQ